MKTQLRKCWACLTPKSQAVVNTQHIKVIQHMMHSGSVAALKHMQHPTTVPSFQVGTTDRGQQTTNTFGGDFFLHALLVYSGPLCSHVVC